MCNHYLTAPKAVDWAADITKARLSANVRHAIGEQKNHIYPKYPAGIVTVENGVREVLIMRWGVWPFYAREKPQYITNARRDGLLTKPTWKNSAKKRRCLVPAVGYFEPGLGPVGAKGEVRFAAVERQHFFIAGLWDRDPNETGERGFTLVTTEPNEYAARFHDRMPVVLSDAEALDWLGEEPLADDVLMRLCRGLPASALSHTEIPVVKGKITKADIASGTAELF